MSGASGSTISVPLWLPTRHVGVASWFSFLSAHDIRHLFHLSPQSTPPPSTETPTSFDVKYLSGLGPSGTFTRSVRSSIRLSPTKRPSGR